MQVPERIRLRDLDSPPHGWFDAFQGYFKLVCAFKFLFHACPEQIRKAGPYALYTAVSNVAGSAISAAPLTQVPRAGPRNIPQAVCFAASAGNSDPRHDSKSG